MLFEMHIMSHCTDSSHDGSGGTASKSPCTAAPGFYCAEGSTDATGVRCPDGYRCVANPILVLVLVTSCEVQWGVAISTVAISACWSHDEDTP